MSFIFKIFKYLYLFVILMCWLKVGWDAVFFKYINMRLYHLFYIIFFYIIIIYTIIRFFKHFDLIENILIDFVIMVLFFFLCLLNALLFL